MTTAVLILFIVFAIFCSYKMSTYKPKAVAPVSKRELPSKPKPKTVLNDLPPRPKPEPIEPPIESVVANIKEKERLARLKDQQDWDRKFYSSIPETEHPDYLEVSIHDRVDEGFTVNSVMGAIQTIQTRINKDGKRYGYIYDHLGDKGHITHKTFQKAVEWHPTDFS